jgi:alpha-L-fucosidase
VATATTSERTEVRFTVGGDTLYATLLDPPGARTFDLRAVEAGELRHVGLLGADGAVDWSVHDGRVSVTLPERLPVSPAHVLRLEPAGAVRVPRQGR